MGFASLDALLAAITAGQFIRRDIYKITGAAAYTAGRWYNMSTLNGYPTAIDFSAGSALTAVAMDDDTAGALYHAGDKSPDTKHLLNAGLWTTSSTGIPGVLMIVDFLLRYPGINMNSGSQQDFTNVATLPRYTNGIGVMAFLQALSTYGSTAHNIAISYTDQSDNASNALGATVADTVSAIVPHISHSGVAANNYGPFLPLAAGDVGIKSVESLTLSAATSSASTACLTLCKPIASIQITQQYVGSEKSYVFQVPSFPKIEDGACLGFLFFAGAAVAASSIFQGFLDFAWD